jgi:hypothetical protein
VPVEVQVRAAGEVRRVEAIAAGFRVGSTDEEPYLFEWDTGQLASGRHTLDVTVLDSLGNRATKQVAVLVEAAARPTPVPPPTPAPAAVVPQQPADYPLLPGGLAILAVLLLAAVVVRRRSRPSRRLTQYKDERLSKCPTCGGRLKRGRDCPVCRAEDDKLIQRRLRELAGKPPEDEPEREGQP